MNTNIENEKRIVELLLNGLNGLVEESYIVVIKNCIDTAYEKGRLYEKQNKENK